MSKAKERRASKTDTRNRSGRSALKSARTADNRRRRLARHLKKHAGDTVAKAALAGKPIARFINGIPVGVGKK